MGLGRTAIQPLKSSELPDSFTVETRAHVKNFSIIAIHGLNPRSVSDHEHAFNTWRKPPEEGGRLWLRDDLPKYTPKARVFLYEYNSKVAYGVTQGRFFDKANDLLEDLYLERSAVSRT